MCPRGARVHMLVHYITRSLNRCTRAIAKQDDVASGASATHEFSCDVAVCSSPKFLGLLLRATRRRSSTRDGLWLCCCSTRISRARCLLVVGFALACDARELHLRSLRARRTQSHCIATAHSHLQCTLRRGPSCGAGPSPADRLQAFVQAVAQRGHSYKVGYLLVHVRAARPLASR